MSKQRLLKPQPSRRARGFGKFIIITLLIICAVAGENYFLMHNANQDTDTQLAVKQTRIDHLDKALVDSQNHNGELEKQLADANKLLTDADAAADGIIREHQKLHSQHLGDIMDMDGLKDENKRLKVDLKNQVKQVGSCRSLLKDATTGIQRLQCALNHARGDDKYICNE